MTEVALGVALFTGIVMTLVGLVLLARAWLVPTGSAQVLVNGERAIGVGLGEKLLAGLQAAGVLLPAGCGGKGTCGQCRVVVAAGGGAPLPTEAGRLSRREIADGIRLACQLRVTGPLEIRVPEEILGVTTRTCRVRSARCVASFIKEIVLDLPHGESIGPPAGRYVLVTCPPYRIAYRDLPLDAEVRAEWEQHDLLHHVAGCDAPATRAYSLASYPDEPGIAMLIVRIATPPPALRDAPPGVVSSWLFSLRPGDAVEVTGPYGHATLAPGDAELVLVGGGAGMAPIRAHVFDLLLRQQSARRIRFFYGARSRRELFYVEDFERLAASHPNFSWTVALSEPRPEDRWEGETGFIHEVLRRTLAEHGSPESCDYYLCGPPLMVRAVRSLLDGYGVDPERVVADDFGSASRA